MYSTKFCYPHKLLAFIGIESSLKLSPAKDGPLLCYIDDLTIENSVKYFLDRDSFS
jgi:hypothetical protein